MKDDQIIVLAEELYKAQNELFTLEPFSEQHPEITIEDAYQIQTYITKKRVKSGRKVVGKKIGLTSIAMQEMFKVSQPDYGSIFDDLVYAHGSVINRSKMIQPRIEAEIAFLLKKDLPGPGITPLQVLQACEGVLPSLEIIDSRIKNWRIKIQDTIADNASCWGVVLGPKVSYPLGIDYRVLGLSVYKNSKLVATAAGAAVLGDPLISVAWLANKLSEYGDILKAGDIVLSGSLIAAFPIEKGDCVQAIFDRIGEVSVTIC